MAPDGRTDNAKKNIPPPMARDNKNRFVIGYFLWRVMTGQNARIEYLMQISSTYYNKYILDIIGLISVLFYYKQHCVHLGL